MLNRAVNYMTIQVNAILINEADNVATAIVELVQGERAKYWAREQIVEIPIRENIPRYHKFAVRDIRKMELVRKYGEVIGQALCDISQGAHVHVHNIESPGRSES
jgi:altronate dehydratase small subunit